MADNLPNTIQIGRVGTYARMGAPADGWLPDWELSLD
jgi:hypothetical protein